MELISPLPWQRALWEQLVGWRDRLPHALLLHGARGIGKKHLMKAFAQLLLCEAPIGATACGRCTGCCLFAAENHPDLRWLTPAAQMPERTDADTGSEAGGSEVPEEGARSTKAKPSREIVIDQVRRTTDFLSVSSHRGGLRVVLLIPAEALNDAAANALLKTLEEPPSGAVFVAVSDELDAVLPTIRSRCLLLRAPRPGRDQALAWLRSLGIDDAEWKLAEAGGAPVGIASDTSPDDRRHLDPVMREALLKLLSRGAALSGADVAGAVPKDIAVAPAIRLLQRWGWDLLAERLAGRVRYYPQHRRQVAALARAVEPSRLVGWTAALAQMQAASDHPLNSRLVVENGLLGYINAMRSETGR